MTDEEERSSITRDSHRQDDSKYDETRAILESLGKFKSSEALLQVKDRSYRSHSDTNEFQEVAYDIGESKYEKDDRYKKPSQTSSTKHIQESDVKTERTSSKFYTSRSSSDCRASSSSSSHKQSPVSSDCGYKSASSTLHSSLETVKSSRNNRSDDRSKKDLSSSSEKSRLRSDDNDSVKKDRERNDSTVDIRKRNEEDLSRFEREQTELQKRIQELKKEICHEKSKIKEIESRVSDSKMLDSKQKSQSYSSSSKLSSIDSSHASGKSSVHKSSYDTASHLQKSTKHHSKQSDPSRCSKDRSRSRSRGRNSKPEGRRPDIRGRSPQDIGRYDGRKEQARDDCKKISNLRDRDDYGSRNRRSSSRESGKRKDYDSSRKRSESRSDERHSRTKYIDRSKPDLSSSYAKREEIPNSVKTLFRSLDSPPSSVKRNSRSPILRSRNCQDKGQEDNRNLLNKYLRSYHSQVDTSAKAPRSSSTFEPSKKKASDRHESPSSVYSFDLDWPRSPRQPGVNLRSKDDCISPISQLHASGDAWIFKEQSCSKITRDKTETGSSSPSILKPQLLAKRYNLRHSTDIWAQRSTDCFELMQCIGRGSFGQIFKAADKDKNLLVAVRKITVDIKYGFPAAALCELISLNLVKHPNIICLLEIAREVLQKGMSETLGMYYFVYEYVPHDLKGIIESNLVKLSPDNISSLMIQLLSALEYCHNRDLVHCDVKSSSILVNYRGQLKLAQFGMSRNLKDASKKGLQLGKGNSLWYQPPEVLLGSEECETSLDMWSAGCILAEMFQQKPLFPSRDDLHQLCMISALCGSPNAAVWPDVAQLPRYYTIKSRAQHPRQLREEFYFLPSAALDLLDALLMLDPQKRCTAAKALKMDWLRNIDILKMPSIVLPKTTDCHSILNESKSESKDEAASQRIKSNFSPDSFHSAKEFSETGIKRKKFDPAIVRLALSNAIDALQQHQVPNLQQKEPSIEPSTADSSSSLTKSSPKVPPSGKGGLLKLRVKDYQHQTVSSELQSDSTGYVSHRTNQEPLLRDKIAQAEKYRLQEQTSDLPSSEFGSRSFPGLRYKTFDYSDSSSNRDSFCDRNRDHSTDRVSAEMVTSEPTRTPAAAVPHQSFDGSAPTLSESSVAFWDAMKVYCANLGTSTGGPKSTESSKSSSNVQTTIHGRGHPTYPAGEISQHGSSRKNAPAADPRALSYPDLGYSSSYTSESVQSYNDVNSEATITPKMYSDNANFSVSYSSHSADPRIQSRMRFGGRYDSYDNPSIESCNVESMQHNEKSGYSLSTPRVDSSSRIHHVVPRSADKPESQMLASAASVKPGQNFDLAKKFFDQTSEFYDPYAPTPVTSSLAVEREMPVSPHPRLTGILKNRKDVCSEAQAAWTQSQPNQ